MIILQVLKGSIRANHQLLIVSSWTSLVYMIFCCKKILPEPQPHHNEGKGGEKGGGGAGGEGG
jgi:hypothetical protein